MNELGIGDPSLVGYVAQLLASFVPSQAVWQIRDAQGRQLGQVTAMVAEAESSTDAARRRECHRHVGDFTLFWTGVYPEALAKLQGPSKADGAVNYQQQGKRSYHLASTLSDSRVQGSVLQRLSDQFSFALSDSPVSAASGRSLKRSGPRPGEPAGRWSSEVPPLGQSPSTCSTNWHFGSPGSYIATLAVGPIFKASRHPEHPAICTFAVLAL